MGSIKVDVTHHAPSPKKGIGLLDGVVFVLSCTIGSGLFFSPIESADAVKDPWVSLLAWLIAGILSLAGSLIYSELGTSLVSASAESTYLEKAFGPAMSFTFSWTLSTIIGPSACACISWVLGRYFASIFEMSSPTVIFAVAIWVMVLLCCVNLLNPNYILMLNRFNVCCKIMAVSVVVIGGVVAFATGFQPKPFLTAGLMAEAQWGQLGKAVMFALFALSGWNMLNPLTEEMSDPAKDVPKVYTLGMISTMVLAIIVNAAFFAALPAETCRNVTGPGLANPFAEVLLSPGALRSLFRIVLSLLICFCCLGSCNGIMMGTSKCIASNGREGVLPRIMGATSSKHHVPYVSVVAFTTWTSFLIFMLYLNPSEALSFIVNIYTVGQWGFFVVVGLSLFVLRVKFPNLERPYKIHLYPAFPALFVLVAAFIVVISFIGEQYKAAIIAAVIILAGTGMYYASNVDFFRKIYFKVAACVPDLAQDGMVKPAQLTKGVNAPAVEA